MQPLPLPLKGNVADMAIAVLMARGLQETHLLDRRMVLGVIVANLREGLQVALKTSVVADLALQRG